MTKLPKLTYKIKLFDVPKPQRLDLIFSNCNLTTFQEDTYFHDTRSTHRLFLVLSVGAMTGTVSPESSPKEVKSLTKHSIVLIPKGQCLKMFFPKGLKVAAFHFNACDILGRELFENQNQIYLLEKSSAWIRLFKQFLVKPFSKNLTDFMNALLGEFHKDFAQKEEVEDLVLTSFKPLFDLLEHSPPATLSVKKIAQAVGKSEGALSKAFNRLAGVSLKAFLLKQTLQKVERELIYSLKPMKEIAADLGFYDEFAFSKFSKRHLGLAPSHFREKHQTF